MAECIHESFGFWKFTENAVAIWKNWKSSRSDLEELLESVGLEADLARVKRASYQLDQPHLLWT